MPRFSYVAIDVNDKVIKGRTELPDRSAVIAALTKQGLRPASIRRLKDQKKSSIDWNNIGVSAKVKSDNLVIFTRQLSAMVGAGVPLMRALSSLEQHTEDRALKTILTQIVKDVEGGTPLGDALAKHPETFNDIYTNMVRAGESAGILDEILKRLAFQQERSTAIRKKIKSAMTYPLVLVAITVMAFFGLMLFVVPQIGKIVKDLGGPDAELPMITKIMLNVSDVITGYWFVIIPAIIGVTILINRYIKTPRGKKQWHTLLLKIPVIKDLVTKLSVARFSRTFSSLMGAGVAVLQALDVTSRAVGNVLFEEALQDAAREVKNGRQLSAVIERNELFPSIVSQMLAVGEETGQTDTVLIKVAEFYEEEVDLSIESVSSIIEPVMIIFMGGMVGVIAASVMLPIAQLSQNIR